MSDRSSGWMTIHGVFPYEHLDRLIETIYEEGGGPDWGVGFEDHTDVREYILERIDAGHDPYVCDSEASGGEFYDLQSLCRELKVPFTAGWSACEGSYDAGLKMFDGVREDVCPSVEDEPVARLSEIKLAVEHNTLPDLVEKLERMLGKGMPRFELKGPLTRQADELCPETKEV